MTKSSFYCDGYEDASNGLKSSPPAPYKNHKGVTNVHAAEYCQGYADFLRVEREATGGMLLEANNAFRA